MTFASRSSWKTGAAAPPVSGDLVMEFSIPSNGYTIYFELGDVYPSDPLNVTIDWGNGSSITYNTAGLNSYTYATSGTYIVSFSGACNSISGFDSITLGIISWNNSLGLKELQGTGAYVPNNLPSTLRLVTIKNSSFNDPSVLSWDTSNLTSMFGTFFDCAAFNQNISSWNTSNVTNMQVMFRGATAFNQPIGSWDMSNVTSIGSMFEDAVAFNQPLNAWDTSSVTQMPSVFRGATLFNQSLNSWDTSSVINMDGLFGYATNFNGNISSWNTSNVVFMGFMFEDAAAFNQDISSWDTSNVEEMAFMFRNATAFNQPLNTWDVGKAYLGYGSYGFWQMFKGATSFNQPLFDWDTSNITNMDEMFSGAAAFNQNISTWCVTGVSSLPSGFNTGGILSAPYFPVWGTCDNPTSLLLHFDGTNGQTTTVDSSTYGLSVTLTNATLSTTTPKFGSASLNVVGASSGYAQVASNAVFQMGDRDFTIECFTWLNSNAFNGSGATFINYDGTPNGGQTAFMLQNVGDWYRLALGTSASDYSLSSAGGTSLQAQWVFLAGVREGSTLSFYVNSNRVATTTISGSVIVPTVGPAFRIGQRVVNGGQQLDGKVDEVRITKGLARYSGATITVPTAPFTS